MAKKGPPPFFQQQPQQPARVPVPRVNTRGSGGGKKSKSPGGGAKKAPRAGAAAGAAEGDSIWRNLLEEWRIWTVAVVSVILLGWIAFSYVRGMLRETQITRAVGEVAYYAATLRVIERDLGGFRAAEPLRQDQAALLNTLRLVAEGGALERNAAGEITGATAPAKGAPPLFVTEPPKRSATGAPFRFVFSGPEGGAGGEEASATLLPAVSVEGIGTARPPAPGDPRPERWFFDGDLTAVPRSLVIGGEEAPVTLRRGDGGAEAVILFRAKAAEPSPDAGS